MAESGLRRAGLHPVRLFAAGVIFLYGAGMTVGLLIIALSDLTWAMRGQTAPGTILTVEAVPDSDYPRATYRFVT